MGDHHEQERTLQTQFTLESSLTLRLTSYWTRLPFATKTETVDTQKVIDRHMRVPYFYPTPYMAEVSRY